MSTKTTASTITNTIITTTTNRNNNHDDAIIDEEKKEDETPYCIGLRDIEKAAERIKDAIVRTPVVTSDAWNADRNGSRRFYFKIEAFQKTGSFKFRGALNAIRASDLATIRAEKGEEQDGGDMTARVVTHSSGNFAQAVALGAKMASSPNWPVKATVVMPQNAPTVKQKAVVGYGADLVLVECTGEARQAAADRIVKETGATFIHSSENPFVIAGQGTCGLEFMDQVGDMIPLENATGTLTNGTIPTRWRPPLDVVIIPVGGGGLSAGCTIAFRELCGSGVKIVLAEPAELDDAKRSFESGKLMKHHPGNRLESVADGLKMTLGWYTWPIVRDLVDDIITVSERDILAATKRIWETLKICVEPSAAVAAAVAWSDEFHDKYPPLPPNDGDEAHDCYQRVGVILSGGNVDIIKVAKKMEECGL